MTTEPSQKVYLAGHWGLSQLYLSGPHNAFSTGALQLLFNQAQVFLCKRNTHASISPNPSTSSVTILSLSFYSQTSGESHLPPPPFPPPLTQRPCPSPTVSLVLGPGSPPSALSNFHSILALLGSPRTLSLDCLPAFWAPAP